MTVSACLSDDELAGLATSITPGDPRLPHVESCDACRAIWLHARDIDAPAWTVGRYEVRGTLGAGGLGVVLLGWDPVLAREVAIKFPAEHEGLLLREAQALAAIRHPNVVAVHDFGDVDGEVYFTMERVAGVPFDTWWLGATAAERVRALLEIAAGLDAIHVAGLVHCDIKPGNIVVARDGHAVIVDLGLATSHGTAATLAGGTPGYRAPEIERGGAPSVASDEYAFWCVVRQCLASARLSARQRRLADDLIARGTSDDPEQRFGSLAACSAALRALTTTSKRWVLPAALAGAAALGGTAFALTRQGAAACETNVPRWSAEIESRLATRLPAETLARVKAFVDRERTTAHDLLVHACEAPQEPAALRTKWCVLSSWRWIDGNVRTIAAGRDVANALDELPVGVPIARCAPGGVTASPPAVDADATPASRKVHVAIAATAALPPTEAIARLDTLGAEVEALHNPGLTAAWHLERTDALRRAGKERDAIASAEAAIDVATRNGDDLVLARARLHLYLLRDVPDRTGAVRDAEVEAIVVRAGSPGLLATFQNAAAQRAIARGELDRARTLLEHAAATHAEIELAPSSQRGSAEQNLGVALQFSRDIEGAQAHFDRAVEIFTARYGRDDEITIGARLNAATNQLYRGDVQAAVPDLDALAAELARAKRDRTAIGAHVAMARCQAGQATGKDALARCQDALAINRDVFGKEHVEILPALLAVAQVTMSTSVRDALPLLEEAIAIAEKQAGNPTDLPYARGLYALALKVTGRKDDGLAVAREAIGDLEKLGQKDLVRTLRENFPTLP